MIRWLSCLVVLLALTVIAGCCSHPVEVAALRDLEAKQEKYFDRYLKYVDSDPAVLAPEKNDIRETVGAIKRQTTSVRKSIGGEE